jgi:hypothetical protein
MGCFQAKINKTEPSRNEKFRMSTRSENFIKKQKGRVRDHYWLGKVIGEGAFGEVRIGNHIVSGEDRAIKFINK